MNWLCFLYDEKDNQRVVVGEFTADHEGDAIDKAKHVVRSTMKNFQTARWYMAAEPAPVRV
jgi:hypothetical protein